MNSEPALAQSRLVIHVGDHKAGSTSLQRTLRTEAWSGGTQPLIYVGPHSHAIAGKLTGDDVPASSLAAVERELSEALAGLDGRVGVVSSELFERVEPAVLASVLDRAAPSLAATTEVVTYVRPHIDRLVSTWAERVKIGRYRGTLQRFAEMSVRRELFLFAPRFDAWRAVFGDRFTVRPLVSGHLYQSCVVRDFLRLVFRSEDFLVSGDTRANESLSLEDLVAMREFHRVFAADRSGEPVRGQQAIARHIASMLAQKPVSGATTPRVDRVTAQRLVHHYRADAEAVDARFFDGPLLTSALDAAPDKAVDEAQSVRIADHLSSETVRMVRVWARTARSMTGMRGDWNRLLTGQRYAAEAQDQSGNT